MRSHLGKPFASLVGASTLLCIAAVSHADSTGFNYLLSTPTSSLSDNIDINSFLGANTFYSAGYTGTRTIVSNVEGGYVWNQHQTLTGTLLLGTVGVDGQYDQHATWVGQAIAGQGTQVVQQGIAYGAQLWSGAVATNWNPPATPGGYSESFNFTGTSFLAPYLTSMVTGVTTGTTTHTADVINSSWGYTNTDGASPYTETIDALVNTTHKIVVAAVGNNGYNAAPNQGTPDSQVTGIAAGYNSIGVGATSGALNAQSGARYGQVAGFSSYGPNDYNDPNGPVAADYFNNIGRSQVDILAPGTNLTLARYGGTTGGNAGGTDPTGGATNLYSSNLNGTSFSSALVAGGAALLVDAGKSQFGGGNAIDSRVIKAVLMASADQLLGWDNGLTPLLDANGNNITNAAGINIQGTNLGLDYYQGAGQMNLTTAYQVYLGGTAGIAGGKGGFAGSVGWDLGTVSTDIVDSLNTNDYYLGELYGNTTFTSVLTWNVDDSFNGLDSSGNLLTSQVEFANLDLLLFEMINGTWMEIAESDSLNNNYLLAGSGGPTANNTIELSLGLSDTALYMFEVRYDGEMFNTGSPTSGVTYGVAWNAVPEPGTFALCATTSLFALTFVLRRRRK